MNFFNIISSITNRRGVLTNTNPIRMLVIGDSIANGTNENGVGENEPPNPDFSITGHANPDTLFEWDGSQLLETENDIIDANNGSMHPSFANKIKEITGRKTHIIETATGGDGMATGKPNNWASEGNRYAPMLVKANSYLQNQGVGSFTFIKITGGTNDVYTTTPLEEVEADFFNLVDRLHTDFPNTKISWSNIALRTERMMQINQIIQRVVDQDPLVYIGEAVDNYYPDLMFDGVHMTQEGNNIFGEADAVIINNTIL